MTYRLRLAECWWPEQRADDVGTRRTKGRLHGRSLPSEPSERAGSLGPGGVIRE
jgi:hypothetical protein